MPSTLLPQCLFCKHFNPADAIFCNGCGNQLNLQPCKGCGAINDRAAENCYKCSASFALLAQPEPESLLEPAILGQGLASSTLGNAGPSGTLPTQPTRDLALVPTRPQRAAKRGASETGASATRSRRRWLVTIAVLLLVLAVDMVAVYFYYGEPEQLAQTEIEKAIVSKQAVPDVLGEPKSDSFTSPNAVIPVDAALKPENMTPKSATRLEVTEKMPSRAPPQAVAALAVRPLPATTAAVRILQEPPVVKECPQAVATLGLCNAPTNE